MSLPLLFAAVPVAVVSNYKRAAPTKKLLLLDEAKVDSSFVPTAQELLLVDIMVGGLNEE